MTQRPVYNDAMRALQRRFGTEALADALARHNRREAFTADDTAFVERLTCFFLATTDADGFPDCSYKGGAPGHLKVLSPESLSFPCLDGNGMFRSMGNIQANPSVGLLFIDFEAPRRLRVNGRARLVFDDPRQAEVPGAMAMIHVDELAIFTNCPRYIHSGGQLSDYLDQGDGQAKVPDWKRREEFNPLLPDHDPAKGGTS